MGEWAKTQQKIEKNQQTLWATFKEDLTKVAKKHCSQSRGKLAKKIVEVDKNKGDKRNNIDASNKIRVNEMYLANKLKHLKHI